MTHTETHSDLPWKYSEGYHVIVDAKGYFLGTLAQSGDNALTIRSVNALPSLVEALETLKRNMNIIQGRNDTPPHIASVLKQQEEIARTALALAKGE